MINYLKDKYTSTQYGNFDLSVVFIEKAIKLAKKEARVGLIVLNKFFTTKYGLGLRKLISSKKYLEEIVDFNNIKVFDDATTYTSLLYLKKNINTTYDYTKVKNLNNWLTNKDAKPQAMDINDLDENPWYFGSDNYRNLENKIKGLSNEINDIAESVFVGVQTNCDDVFILEAVESEGNITYCKSKHTGKVHPFETDYLKKLVKGSDDIHRYSYYDKKRLIFPYVLGYNRPPLINEEDYIGTLTWEYLLECKEVLESRTEVINKTKEWYQYGYHKNHARYEQVKILIPALCNGSRFVLDELGEFYFTGSGKGGGGGYALTLKDNTNYDYHSLLGVLNSKVISFFITHNGDPRQGGYQGIDREFIIKLLVPKITHIDTKKMDLIEQISTTTQSLIKVSTANIQNSSEAKINRVNELKKSYDDEINQLVYELYELNDYEIEFIEEFLS